MQADSIRFISKVQGGAMGYLVQYPLYFILTKEEQGDGIGLVSLQHDSVKASAIPIFTDEDGAQEFLDKHFVGWRLGMIPDEPFLAKLLKPLRERISLVAFDPWRMGARTATIAVDEMLDQLENG
jgi:hypothetical protein